MDNQKVTDTKQESVTEKKNLEDTIAEEEMEWIDEVLKTIPKNIQPVFGYRFILEGDFNGDGTKEKLIEHFYSKKEGKETNKFYENIEELDQLIALTIKKEPESFLLSDNKQIDTLHIDTSDNFGLAYLKNEGDLNGDGTDEISYVINHADYSNLNSWHIATYKNNKWTEIYQFDIWDWQLPDLPETFNHYGLFGLQEKIINTKNDSVNKLLEADLKNFKGLVRKVKKNHIEITYRTEEADEGKKTIRLDQIH